MKLLTFFIILFLIGCTPQKRLNRIVRKHPELLTQQVTTLHDTITIPQERSERDFRLRQDSIALDSLLNKYAELTFEWGLTGSTTLNSTSGIEITDAPSVDTRKRLVAYQKLISQLKAQIVKAVLPDTTFTINPTQTFLIGDSTIYVRTNIKIHVDPKGLHWVYQRDPFKIPYTKTTVTQTVDARIGKPFYKIWWFWLFLITLIVALRKPIMKIIVRFIPIPPKL